MYAQATLAAKIKRRAAHGLSKQTAAAITGNTVVFIERSKVYCIVYSIAS
jgi:hypothetical protein